MTAVTIPSVVRAAAVRYADREAVVDGSSRPTFAEVAAAVERIERALIASGVQPGDRVAIWAPNSLPWILASFAVYGAGRSWCRSTPCSAGPRGSVGCARRS